MKNGFFISTLLAFLFSGIAWSQGSQTDEELVEPYLRLAAVHDLNLKTQHYQMLLTCAQSSCAPHAEREATEFFQFLPNLIRTYRYAVALQASDWFLSEMRSYGTGAQTSLNLFVLSSMPSVRFEDPIENGAILAIIERDRSTVAKYIEQKLRMSRQADPRAFERVFEQEMSVAKGYYKEIMIRLIRDYPFLISLNRPNPQFADIERAIQQTVHSSRGMVRRILDKKEIELKDLIWYNEAVERMLDGKPELADPLKRLREKTGPLHASVYGWIAQDLAKPMAQSAMATCFVALIINQLRLLCSGSGIALGVYSLYEILFNRIGANGDAFRSGLVDLPTASLKARRILGEALLAVLITRVAVKGLPEAFRNTARPRVYLRALRMDLNRLTSRSAYAEAVVEWLKRQGTFIYQRLLPSKLIYAPVPFAAGGLAAAVPEVLKRNHQQLFESAHHGSLIPYFQIIDDFDSRMPVPNPN